MRRIHSASHPPTRIPATPTALLAAALLCGACASTPKHKPPAPATATKASKPTKAPKANVSKSISDGALPLKKLQQAKATTIDAAGLVAVLLAPKTPLKADGKLELTFELQNPGDAPRTFCDYHTPFEGIRNNLFELVDSQGKKLSYRGMMAKRAAPTVDNFWVVPPKSRVRVNFSLAKAYAPKAGSYTLRFAGNGISGLPASKAITLVIE